MIEITAAATGRRYAGNYDLKSDETKRVVNLLTPVLVDLHSRGVRRYISGGAIGFDLIYFYTVHKLKKELDGIENILALPFDKQSGKWSQDWQNWYEKAKKLADSIVRVDLVPGYEVKGKESPYIKRDYWMVDQSRHLVAGWDSQKHGGTWKTIEYAMKHFREITYINVYNPTQETKDILRVQNLT